MRRLVQIFTSLTFAVHAVLGCCAHHACGRADAHEPKGPSAHVSHDCHGNDCERSEPVGEKEWPSQTCEHTACSFVKAELVQVAGPDVQVCWVMTLDGLAGGSGMFSGVGFLNSAEYDFSPNLAAAPLYVWHCALLI